MDFKTFVTHKINYFVSHFRKKAVLLDFNGDALHEINLSFDHLSDLYLSYMEEISK